MKNYDYFKSTQSTINFAQLIKSKNLKNLSLGAKAVYSLLIDALNKSGQIDKLGHAFIVYPIKTIMTDLNISKQTAINYLYELTKEGLITKFKRGLGMASLIYPMDCGFAAKSNTKITDESSGQELTTSKVKKLDPYNDIYLHTSYNLKFNNNINKSNLIKSDEIGDKSDYDTALNDFTKQLNAINLKKNHPEDAEIIDGMVELLSETFMVNSKKMLVCGKSLPTEIVKSRLLGLREEHIEYVLECLTQNTSKIKNVKKYLLAALFNAPATLMSYTKNKESQKISGPKEKEIKQDYYMPKNAFGNFKQRDINCDILEKQLLTLPFKKQMA